MSDLRWCCVEDSEGPRSWEYAAEGSITLSDGATVTYHDAPQQDKIDAIMSRNACPMKAALMAIDPLTADVSDLAAIVSYLQSQCG